MSPSIPVGRHAGAGHRHGRYPGRGHLAHVRVGARGIGLSVWWPSTGERKAPENGRWRGNGHHLQHPQKNWVGSPVDAQRSSAPKARSRKSKHCVLKWTMPSARQPGQPWRHSLPRLRCWPALFRCRAVSWGRHGPCGHRAGAGLDLHRGGHCLAAPPTLAGASLPAFLMLRNRGQKAAAAPVKPGNRARLAGSDPQKACPEKN